MTDYYVLSEIKCKGLKPGIIHDFHKTLRGRKCYMITCEKGKDCWFGCNLGNLDDIDYHRIKTTTVIECKHNDDGSIEVETYNTFYKFRPFGGFHTVEGDVFESNADVIVHQVNCQGVMGSGVAKQVREKFPEVFKAYQKRCRDTLTPLGHTLFVKSEGTVIANLFAQDKFGYDGKCYTDYEALRQCLTELSARCRGKVVAIPYLMACHRGGGDWDKVSKMIQEVLVDCDVTFYKYTA